MPKRNFETSVPSPPNEAVLKASSFTTPKESPGFLLWQLSNGWQRRIRNELDQYGLTHSQFVLLAGISWLNRMGTGTTQVELARHSHMDVVTTSQILRLLEKKGLVVRNKHLADSRAKSLTLTASANVLLGEAISCVEQADHEFFEPLGDDLAAFQAAMTRLIAAVSDES